MSLNQILIVGRKELFGVKYTKIQTYKLVNPLNNFIKGSEPGKYKLCSTVRKGLWLTLTQVSYFKGYWNPEDSKQFITRGSPDRS